MDKWQNFFKFLFWVFFLLLIMGVAGYLIIIANGYKIHYKTWRLSKTGMIYLKSDPKGVAVYINGQYKSDNTPFRLADIFPGRYDVKITKPDYHEWTKTFVVTEGLSSSEENIMLFLQKPPTIPVTEAEKTGFSALLEQWPAKGLEIKNNNEIWFNDILVTRFSQPVKSVSWYRDLKHIIFQLDQEISIIDPDGANNIQLISLSSDQPSQFLAVDDGQNLLYKDGEEIKKIKIK